MDILNNIFTSENSPNLNRSSSRSVSKTFLIESASRAFLFRPHEELDVSAFVNYFHISRLYFNRIPNIFTECRIFSPRILVKKAEGCAAAVKRLMIFTMHQKLFHEFKFPIPRISFLGPYSFFLKVQGILTY